MRATTASVLVVLALVPGCGGEDTFSAAEVESAFREQKVELVRVVRNDDLQTFAPADGRDVSTLAVAVFAETRDAVAQADRSAGVLERTVLVRRGNVVVQYEKGRPDLERRVDAAIAALE
jgi:hypothetical protein